VRAKFAGMRSMRQRVPSRWCPVRKVGQVRRRWARRPTIHAAEEVVCLRPQGDLVDTPTNACPVPVLSPVPSRWGWRAPQGVGSPILWVISLGKIRDPTRPLVFPPSPFRRAEAAGDLSFP
jgi:hypothetical protein